MSLVHPSKASKVKRAAKKRRNKNHFHPASEVISDLLSCQNLTFCKQFNYDVNEFLFVFER